MHDVNILAVLWKFFCEISNIFINKTLENENMNRFKLY